MNNLKSRKDNQLNRLLATAGISGSEFAKQRK